MLLCVQTSTEAFGQDTNTTMVETAAPEGAATPTPKVFNRVVCYHHDDADGVVSGVIVRHSLHRRDRPVELHALPYGKDLNHEQYDENTLVVMVDLTRPDDLTKIAKKAGDLIWIDHHERPFTELQKTGFNPKGIRDSSCSATKLCWKYFQGGIPAPKWIELVNQFDMGDWMNDPPDKPQECVIFQYGLLSMDAIRTDHELWPILLALFTTPRKCMEIMERGQVAYAYDQYLMQRREAPLIWEQDLFGHCALVANSSADKRQVFDHRMDKTRHEILLVWHVDGGGKFKASLYSVPGQDVDVSGYASEFGGGGHPCASGFRCSLADGMKLLRFPTHN